MSEPIDPIQALLTQVDNALHQLRPPIPQFVWGPGVMQSRQVLQQVRDYLTSLQSPREVASEAQEIPVVSPERVTEQLNHLQREVEVLQQERHRLIAEIQQLQIQSQSAIRLAQRAAKTDDSNVSSSVVPQVTANLPELASPHPEASGLTSDHSAGSSTPEPTDLSEDLSDIFGELQFHEIVALDPLEAASITKAESQSLLDVAIHLDSSEPPLDGQEYILASPHENLLPIESDEDQVDSLLLVGRGTLQRLEAELMSLEESFTPEDNFLSQPPDPEEDQFLEDVPSLEQLSAQFEQNVDSMPSTFEALLDPSVEKGIPFPGTAHPEAESFNLKTLSQRFSQSSSPKNSRNPRQSGD